jgi:chromate transport protein ChrA
VSGAWWNSPVFLESSLLGFAGMVALIGYFHNWWN